MPIACLALALSLPGEKRSESAGRIIFDSLLYSQGDKILGAKELQNDLLASPYKARDEEQFEYVLYYEVA
jgi:hypothetical protein